MLKAVGTTLGRYPVWRCTLLAAVLAGGLSQLHAVPQRPAGQTASPYDPYQAEKELEVGRFYLRRKHYDAAIARFRTALRYKPQWALPHRWLGEALEKKGDLEAARREYRTYLNLFPAAPDARRIQRKIMELERRLPHKPSGG